jgi:hypothetical protein
MDWANKCWRNNNLNCASDDVDPYGPVFKTSTCIAFKRKGIYRTNTRCYTEVARKKVGLETIQEREGGHGEQATKTGGESEAKTSPNR